jgi:hypothetical protein
MIELLSGQLILFQEVNASVDDRLSFVYYSETQICAALEVSSMTLHSLSLYAFDLQSL